jgi:hypothetical protein
MRPRLASALDRSGNEAHHRAAPLIQSRPSGQALSLSQRREDLRVVRMVCRLAGEDCLHVAVGEALMVAVVDGQWSQTLSSSHPDTEWRRTVPFERGP